MLIFREVDEIAHEVKGRIALLASEEDATRNEQRLELLMRLVSYINEFSWLKHRALVAKVKTFLRSRYSYQAVAQEHGMSVKQAHKCISYAGDRLRARIGGVLGLIRSGNFTAAERELAVLSGSVDASSLFVRDITERFSPVKDAGVVLGEDCRRELSFLCVFSKKRFDSAVARLDEKTVRHMLYILSSSDSSYFREKELLWNCVVDGSVSVDECIRALNDEFIWERMSDSQM